MENTRYIKKYGITIEENGYYNLRNRYVKLYDIYTADGCCWEKGLSWKGVLNEIKEYGNQFIKIKKTSYGNKRLLVLEYIDYLNSYRAYEQNKPEDAVAYVDDVNSVILDEFVRKHGYYGMIVK